MTESEELELLELEAEEAALMPMTAPQDSEAMAALQGAGKGLTLGYLPELQAVTEQGMLKTANLFGAGFENKTLKESLDSFNKRQKGLERDNPTISKMSEFAGGMALPIPGTGALKSASSLGKIGEAALKGGALSGATGLLQKTDDSVPMITDNPMANLKSRLSSAGYGASLGGAAGGGLTAIGQAIKKIAPTVGRTTSGIPKSAIKTYAKRSDEVNQLIEAGPTSTYDIADDVTNKVKTAFFDKKKEVGQQIGKKLSEAKQSIATDDLFEPLNTKLAELSQSKRAVTPAGQDEIEGLRDFIAQNRSGLPDQIDAQTAFELQDAFKMAGNLQNIKGGYQSRFGNNSSKVEKAVSDASMGAYRKTNEALDKAAGTAGAKKEYKVMADLQKNLEKYFDDPEKTFRTLSGMEAPSKVGARKTVENLQKNIGKDLGIKDQADLLEAYKWFQDPELLPVSSGGTTSTSRNLSMSGAFEALGGILGDRGRDVGRAVGNVVGGPKAVKAIIDGSNKVAPYAGKIKDAALRSAIQVNSPWTNMMNREQEQ